MHTCTAAAFYRQSMKRTCFKCSSGNSAIITDGCRCSITFIFKHASYSQICCCCCCCCCCTHEKVQFICQSAKFPIYFRHPAASATPPPPPKLHCEDEVIVENSTCQQQQHWVSRKRYRNVYEKRNLTTDFLPSARRL